MKNKLLAVFLALLICISSVTHAYASSGARNWYVKRAGSSRPSISDEHKCIEKYNGYYIDGKLSDDSPEKRIYLTFDAGYENGNVEKILNVLKENNVPAAFFILDHIVIKNTDLVKRMADEGHIVCNHTRNHKDMTKLSDDEMRENLSELERIYKEKTGRTMSSYFRFPEGRYSERAIRVANEMGYKTIFWSLCYADWDNDKQPSPEFALKLLLDNTHNGAVVLLHPTSETNAKILPELIKAWRDMGYEFGTMDELVA